MINCEKAKEIPIVSYLNTLGYNPVKVNGNDHWFLSPFRNEKNASFKVNSKLNLWYDHGDGKGGTILDLGTLLFNCTIEEFLKRLSDSNMAGLVGRQEIGVRKEEPKILIKKVTGLEEPKLKDYLSKRNINLHIASAFCSEVEFQIGNKNFLAIGFRNRSNGFELRNDFFKGSSSPKDVTFISNNCRNVCVFEGFMDFLSLLTLKGSSISTTNFLVLNSLNNLDKSLDILKEHKNIFLFLDHDAAGAASVKKAMGLGLNVIDSSGFYKDHKDINEYLISKVKGVLSQNNKAQHIQKRGFRRGL